MKINILALTIFALVSCLANADSKLIGKVVNDERICSLFYKDERYLWFPKDVFVESHFKSKESAFDANNDGKIDHLTLEENFSANRNNMMYYAYSNPDQRSKSKYEFIFPQSWMKCSRKTVNCDLEKKISNGVMDVGLVPGKEGVVHYRSRYTNAFPFIRDEITYYKITTEATNNEVVSIVKPLPDKEKYDVICIFLISKKL